LDGGSEEMTLATGTKLGRYEIRSKIGEGGMGEVYRARDGKLNRDVAIKVLPASLSENADRLNRFEQEAQAAGALNHPNILAVYDVGMHDEAPYVVSELLAGESLKDRLHDGSIAQRKAIDYAIQVAHGLAAAHEQGIVHRDVKPDNLFITKDDRVKILDFGIAKLVAPPAEGIGQTDVATRKVHTDPGSVIGTVGYMSPEQVRGRAVDHRSDIFSFGAVLYEMLSGRRAFHGDSAVETLNAILKEEPPELTTTNRSITPALERVVWHCLEKSPERRFQSATDIAFALESLSSTSAVSGETATVISSPFGRSRITKHLPWIAAGVLLIALLVVLPFAIAHFRSAPTSHPSAVRAMIPAPENAHLLSFNNMAVSPDGLRLAFVAIGANGLQSLWLRPLGALSAQPLAGTEGAISPFWSPDSRFIGFFANGKLKKIDAAGGPPQTLCDAPNGRGGTWNGDGVIVFAPDIYSPLYRVPQAGGTPVPLPLDKSRKEKVYHFPYFLPDGRHFLYRAGVTTAYARDAGNGVYVGSLDSNEYKLILKDDTYAVYASGHLLFWRDGALMAQPFDAQSLQLSGEAVPIAEQVLMNLSEVRAIFSVSENGVLVFQSGRSGGAATKITWFERDGKQAGQSGEPAFGASPHISPDGQRVALMLFDIQVGSTDIWLYDSALSRKTRFTFDPAFDSNPIWSPDGNRIAFNSDRKARLKYDLYLKDASGARNEELLFESNEYKRPTSWSADGRFLAYTSSDGPNGKGDIWVLPFSGERKPFPFLQTAQFDEERARFSLDGRFVAYDSDESGSRQVYVTSFPGPGGKLQVSTNGGEDPLWRKDGKELFFLFEGKLMAAEVKANGSSLDIGNARLLFDAHSGFGPYAHYDVTADGKRFLVATLGEGGSVPMTLVVNWTADLKK
jgi:serine/threonine protein kinase/Tol biopolymer transport system component